MWRTCLAVFTLRRWTPTSYIATHGSRFPLDTRSCLLDTRSCLFLGLMTKNMSRICAEQVIGIWFYDKEECLKVNNLLQRITSAYGSLGNAGTPIASLGAGKRMCA